MSDYDSQSLQKIIDFSSAGWREADRATGLADDGEEPTEADP